MLFLERASRGENVSVSTPIVGMSVTALHVLHKVAFEPIVRLEENVKLLVPGGVVYGKVTFLEPVQPKLISVGSIPAANATTPVAMGATKKLTELELGEREFGQWRLIPLEDFMVQLNLPSSTGRFLTKDGSTYITPFSPLNFVEVYTYSDYVPTIIPYNIHYRAVDNGRLIALGYRYVIEELKEPPEKYTVIPIAGSPITT
jgi:hypothetical protein